VNRLKELSETPGEKQSCEARLRDSVKINQNKHSGRSKKYQVYEWVEQEPQVGEVGMQEYVGPIWVRVKVTKAEVDGVWKNYRPTQRLYDSFHNQWDLHTLFDADAFQTNPADDPDDDEDDSLGDATHIDQVHMAFLDQIKGPSIDAYYSAVELLSSQISIIAPTNLEAGHGRLLA